MIRLREIFEKKAQRPVTLLSIVPVGIMLMPIPVQPPLPPVSLLTWILLAVIGGIVAIFVLIAFILRPLAKRDKSKHTPPAPEPIVEAVEQGEDTLVTTPEPTLITPPPSETITQITVKKDITEVGDAVTLPVTGYRPDGIGWLIAGLSDVGLRRELNEDNYLMIEAVADQDGPYGLYAVADGLGGHEAGEIASQMTVDTILRQFENNPPSLDSSQVESWFKETIQVANDAVIKYQNSHKEAQKMGSTLVMALVNNGQAYISNVGDSRAYHLSADTIRQISIDHSLVERLVQIGQITREEARTHKQRNVVYSIIGEKRRLEIGLYQTSLGPGERILLCSDGLSGLVTDEEILRMSQQESDPARVSQRLVRAAKKAGGHDNITAVLIQADNA
jgi:serine/threonine protein phosphatase PrpC